MTRPPLTADILLAHEPFVRAVVRGLVADEAGVHDIVQETWLAALRRPPREASSLRAWLARVASNRARDARRGAGRRKRREETAARPEALEPVALTHERLAAQREVVDAVLRLDEPYKSVVLLRYWQDLAPNEIAERLGRSAATVRSQLSRAHELLRGRLDAGFDGGRAAWSALLVPLLGEPASAGTVAKLWSGAGVLALVGVAVVAIVVVPRLVGTPEPSHTSAPVVGASAPASAPRRSALATSALTPSPVEPTAPARVVLASELPAVDAGERAQLGSRTTDELLALAVQTQRAIEHRLLTPDEGLVIGQATLLALPDTGVVRLLRNEGGCDRPTIVRGGGAYYSFASEDHSYDAEPDLSFFQGRFNAGFYGVQLGLLAEIGDADLARLPDREHPTPSWLNPAQAEAWRLLWSDIALEDAEHDSAFRERARQLCRSIAPAATSSTYLLRVYSPDEHDHLVAFRPLAFDDEGCTLAWRILRTWPVPGRRSASPFDPRRDEHADIPPGPDWLDHLTLVEQRDLLERIREHARPALLGVPEELRLRFADVVGAATDRLAAKSGLSRILPRGLWDPLVAECGGGAYLSFLEDSHRYGAASELGLEGGRFLSWSERGLLLDVGEVPFVELGAVMSGAMPDGLSVREREAWEFLWTVRATIEGGRRVLAAADAARADELFGPPVPALLGHTYLLRSVLFDSHDHLVAFTVVDGNEREGCTLAWRSLRSWPVEQPPR